MHTINQHYIDGAFVAPHGDEVFELINPSTQLADGSVILGDVEDTRRAIAAANRALAAFSLSTRQERIDHLTRLHACVLARASDLQQATIDEYGAPVSRASWVAAYAAQSFLDAAQVLREYQLERQVGRATVSMQAVGVAALITPWNSTAGSMCSKLAMAIAAGCSTVVKPSEMSALQALIVAEAVHAAALPPGVFNMVTGRGEVVGAELSAHPGVAKISFTGSTAVGKLIARSGVESMKRVSLALSGKSPSILLDDADFASAVPMALDAAFLNNGQACIAGARMLVPRHRLPDVVALVQTAVAAIRVGDPNDPATAIGPLASSAQYERVQRYIELGQAEGARLIAGGPGHPQGLGQGYFVQPTVFADVRNDMQIAREEIFGPVLCIISYDSEDQAVEIANDSEYGLQAYVFSGSESHAVAVAAQIKAGRVMINGLQHEPLAPFGGWKQSGIGREFGVMGLESFLEPKAVISA